MIDIRCSRDGIKCDGCPIIKECEHIELTEEINAFSLYAKGRADAIARDYNTILIYEDTIRSMLLNTSQENNLIEWVDLNGKLNAITHIKHLIYDLEQ